MEPQQPDNPERIGEYDVEGRIGTGGSGTVFLGRAADGSPVAIKLLGQAWLSHPEAPARFRREAEVLRTVRSPRTIRLAGANLAEAPYWIATEYVPGPTLAAAVAAAGPLPVTDAVVLLAALAEGLADVHRHGICHRDLKPQNVILSGTGPRLIDFGVARDPGEAGLTHSGMQVGSLGYAAPELLDGAAPAPAADVFALGATVAYAATGREPFGGGPVERRIARISRGEIDLNGADPWLADAVRACVIPGPDARPAPAEILARCRHRLAQTRTPAGTRPARASRWRSAVPLPAPPAAAPASAPGDASGTAHAPTEARERDDTRIWTPRRQPGR
ncbi:serine/threonine-protein kinase [Catenuloplanes indicus]|uniref:Serine/threonine protein kinase n=1 Tax=Catenuloplanes indicus TaxID=137267 RepID=A0AAE3W673_9ACTN|nr:serine/threonine-protein kinase [Catenuloplanes indicus]MDQ0370025.1 serine/threonine protein kinase [Catenuloplanes indicus]